MDVLLILQKQRQRVSDVEVEVAGVRAELLRPWETVDLHYVVTGESLEEAKVARAISLSLRSIAASTARFPA